MQKLKLSARNDLIFRKLFSSNEHKVIPIGFISDLLNLEVKDITIGNPYSIGSYSIENDASQKLLVTVVDVIVETKDGQTIVIEMQKLKHTCFTERALFYLCQKFIETYGGDRPGDNRYKTLCSTHAIIVADFILWDDQIALRTFKLKDEQNNEYKLSANDRTLLSLTFFELPKEITIENDAIKQWQNYFLDREIDISAPKYIRYASDIIRKLKLGEEEMEMISREEKIEADYYAALEYAVEHGIEQRAEKIRNQGIERGVAQGAEREKIETAKRLLDADTPIEIICTATGLSYNQIKVLK